MGAVRQATYVVSGLILLYAGVAAALDIAGREVPNMPAFALVLALVAFFALRLTPEPQPASDPPHGRSDAPRRSR
jgi:predicted benzoate:H+ symporter BenE